MCLVSGGGRPPAYTYKNIHLFPSHLFIFYIQSHSRTLPVPRQHLPVTTDSLPADYQAISRYSGLASLV